MRFFYAAIRSGCMYSKVINALSKSYSRSAQERDSGGESLTFRMSRTLIYELAASFNSYAVPAGKPLA